MSNSFRWQSVTDEQNWKRDLLVYGNAAVHVANVNGKIIARRLNPLEVMPDLKPLVGDDITS